MLNYQGEGQSRQAKYESHRLSECLHSQSRTLILRGFTAWEFNDVRRAHHVVTMPNLFIQSLFRVSALKEEGIICIVLKMLN